MLAPRRTRNHDETTTKQRPRRAGVGYCVILRKRTYASAHYANARSVTSAAPTHHVEELGVALRLADLVEQEFHRLDFVHVVNELAQHPDLLQDLGLDQQFFAARAGLVEVDRRINALFGETALQVHFHVAGA